MKRTHLSWTLLRLATLCLTQAGCAGSLDPEQLWPSDQPLEAAAGQGATSPRAQDQAEALGSSASPADDGDAGLPTDEGLAADSGRNDAWEAGGAHASGAGAAAGMDHATAGAWAGADAAAMSGSAGAAGATAASGSESGAGALPGNTAQAGAGAGGSTQVQAGMSSDCDFRGLLQTKCGNASCHGAPATNTGLDLTSSSLAMRLAGRKGASSCTDKLLVDTGNPEQSLLYLKVSGSSCGVRMPLGGSLSASEQSCVLTWIEGL